MSLLDTDLLLHTEGQYASANKNTCTNTHISICCQQSQRWVISPMDYIKKGRFVLKCTAQQLSVPWPKQYHPARAPSYRIIPLSSQDKITTICLPFCLSVTAQPSVRQPSTESGSCGLSRLWPRGRSYISNRCKEEVCDIHICLSQCHNATRLNSTYSNFLYALAFSQQVSKWRCIYLQKINLV